MKLTSSQLYMASCTIFANGQMSVDTAIEFAKEIASKINEDSNVIPLEDVRSAVEFIIKKYQRPVSKYSIVSLLQAEFGYSRSEAEGMVDRCEFHKFIINIGTETKTLFELKSN